MHKKLCSIVEDLQTLLETSKRQVNVTKAENIAQQQSTDALALANSVPFKNVNSTQP